MKVREYDYPHKEDNPKLLQFIKSMSGKDIQDSYRDRSENCHITENWNSYDYPEVSKFVSWLEKMTEKKISTIWGVLYNDGGVAYQGPALKNIS